MCKIMLNSFTEMIRHQTMYVNPILDVIYDRWYFLWKPTFTPSLMQYAYWFGPRHLLCPLTYIIIHVPINMCIWHRTPLPVICQLVLAKHIPMRCQLELARCIQAIDQSGTYIPMSVRHIHPNDWSFKTSQVHINDRSVWISHVHSWSAKYFFYDKSQPCIKLK